MKRNAPLSSRAVAHAILLKIFRNSLPVEQACRDVAEFARLSEADRGFAYHLVLSTCRFRGRAEVTVASFLTQPLKAERFDIQLVLLMACVQHFVLATPAHALVNESVELAKQLAPPFGGLVNAVSKKILAQGQPMWDGPEARAARFAPWLREHLAHLPPELREAMADAQEQEAPLDISLKPEVDATALAGQLEASRLPQGSLRLPVAKMDIRQLPGYAEGDWWVQDAAAALVAPLLEARPGQQVLDCCAAPGGKTAQLAATGATVTALDMSAPRLERLRENLERLKLPAEIICADAKHYVPERLYDAVLLDAPCSATGTLRRHPELPWLRQASDISRLVEIQRRLLHRAAEWVRPGGRLVYAVCSLLPEEGEEQATAFLAAHPDFRREAVAPAPGISPDMLTAEGDLRILPLASELYPQALDGFFAARFRKET